MMFNLRQALLAMVISLPLAAAAEITIDGLPNDTVWYMHADLQAMRGSDSGSRVYAWFEEEVVVEVSEELGIDLNKEVDSITAFADAANGAIIIVQGAISKQTQDKMLAMAVLESQVDTRIHNGKEYHFIGEGPEERRRGTDHFDDFEDLEDVSYASFAIDGKAIITSSEAQLQELLDNGGKIAGSGSHDGALFVMSADTSFVQAGLRTDGLADDDDDGWNSNIIRNTRQAALLVSDSAGMIAVEAKLVSTDPKMAAAIGGIINGLISLQAFNSELGPEIQGLIRMTQVEVNNDTLSISTVIDPDLVVTVLGD